MRPYDTGTSAKVSKLPIRKLKYGSQNQTSRFKLGHLLQPRSAYSLATYSVAASNRLETVHFTALQWSAGYLVRDKILIKIYPAQYIQGIYTDIKVVRPGVTTDRGVAIIKLKPARYPKIFILVIPPGWGCLSTVRYTLDR